MVYGEIPFNQDMRLNFHSTGRIGVQCELLLTLRDEFEIKKGSNGGLSWTSVGPQCTHARGVKVGKGGAAKNRRAFGQTKKQMAAAHGYAMCFSPSLKSTGLGLHELHSARKDGGLKFHETNR